MLRIALTGGIACGKSLVAKMLAERGVELIDADDVVHELLPDPVERRRLAAEVFADPEKRKALEARLHPLVRAKIDAFLAGGDAARTRLAVIPLLYETGWDRDYDLIGCVRSSRANQLERMLSRRGYSAAEAEGRLAAQLDVDEKAARSDFVIDNDGTVDELRRRVDEFLAFLKQKQNQQNPKET